MTPTAAQPHAAALEIPTLVRVGSIAGVAGGLAIAAAGMVAGAALGSGFWSLPNAIAGLALGAEAGATRDLGLATLVGVGLHMVLSAGFGVATLWVTRRVTREFIFTALAMGIGLWLFNYYAVGLVSAGARAVASLNPVWLGGALHLLFGAVTGVVARRLTTA